MEIENSLEIPVVTAKLSRRKNAQKRRTEHENAYKSVENPWTLYRHSPDISPASSVVERVIGNDEVSSSILLPGTKTTERGAMSEAMVAAKLMRLGASIFTPAFGHDHPFDLIAHWNGTLSRVQVKTAWDGDNGSILISGQRVVDRQGGKQQPVITTTDCDVIVGYHLETDVAYVIRPVGKTRYQLRRTPAKNGQIIGIMYEQDFRLISLDQIKPIPG
jgi:hypothetical protein